LDDKMACLLRRGCSTNSLMRGTFPHGATETGLKTTSRVAACKCF
jgi:hypothetical protein